MPLLLYYAYIPTTIITLFIGFFIFWNGRHSLLNRLFLIITLLFAIWTISTLIEWTNIHSDLILFLWSFYNLILGLLAIFSIYFFYVFLSHKDISFPNKIIFLLLLLPILLVTPSNFNLSGFNITTCDAFQFEGFPFTIYCASLGILAMIWILFIFIYRYRELDSNQRKQGYLMLGGIESFLFLFFIWTTFTYYLSEIGALPDSSLEMYGMFGMIVFIIYIAFLIVRYKAFNIKLLGAQALVFALVALIGAQFFYTNNITNEILIGVTLVVTGAIGINLVRSVKKVDYQESRLKSRRSNWKWLILGWLSWINRNQSSCHLRHINCAGHWQLSRDMHHWRLRAKLGR